MRKRMNFIKVNRMSNENERPTAWWKWLRAAAGEAQQQEIADSLGVSGGAVTTWKNGVRPNPEAVLAAAKVYGPRVGISAGKLLELAYVDDGDSGELPKGGAARKGGPESLRTRPDAPAL